MSPYRSARAEEPSEKAGRPRWPRDTLVVVMTLTIALPRTVLAIVQHESFGVEATLALVATVLGFASLASTFFGRT